MAYPQVLSITATTFGSDSTTHNVPMPATVSAGDLLVCLFAVDGASTITTPSGWTKLTSNTSVNPMTNAYAKVAVGTEGGTTVNFATSASDQAVAQVYRINDWYGTIATGISAGSPSSVGPVSNPDAPAVTASWGSDDNLFITCAGNSSLYSVTAAPSGFSDLTLTNDPPGNNGASIASARLESTNATEDPGTWTATNATNWRLQTIVIRPSSLVPVTVTPGVASLTLTELTPTVTVSDNKVATPGVRALSLTEFNPAVIIGTVVTPATEQLALAEFAPVVTATQNVSVSPGVATLALTEFSPFVFASDNQEAIPGTASLSITELAPTVSVTNNIAVSPGVLALSLSEFAPTVTATDNKLVTPGALGLVLTEYPPVVFASDTQLVTPGALALSITELAPTISVSDNKSVTPVTEVLAVTFFAPAIIVTADRVATPGTLALVLAEFAPAIIVAPPVAAYVKLRAKAPTALLSAKIPSVTLQETAPAVLLSEAAPSMGLSEKAPSMELRAVLRSS